MHRPAGVTVAGVLLMLIAAVDILTTIVIIQVVAKQHAAAHAEQSATVFTGTLVALSALATVYTWCVAAGLFRSRNWARIGGIVLGILMTSFGVLVLLTAMILSFGPATHPQTASARFGWATGATISFLLAAVGIWLAIYLNSKVAKESFLTFIYAPDTIACPAPLFSLETLSGTTKPPFFDAPAHGDARIPLQTVLTSGGPSLPRIFVLLFSILSIISSTFMLWHALSEKPVFYLGFLMQGQAANIFRIVLASYLWRCPSAYISDTNLRTTGC